MAGPFHRFASWLAPLFEARCASCSTPVPGGAPVSGTRPARAAQPGGCSGIPPARPVLCAACEKRLARRDAGYCPRCGNLAPFPQAAPAPCGECLAAPRPWERFFFHAEYQGLLRDLILRFKSGHELTLGSTLGGLLAGHPQLEALPGAEARYDAVVPMPLHPKKLRERGFNQALELARPLAGRLGAPLAFSLLARTAYTHPQAGLSLTERKRNVAAIFAAAPGVAGKRILLVDDIATTCASLESAAHTLAKAGAASVDVAVVGRTPGHEKG